MHSGVLGRTSAVTDLWGQDQLSARRQRGGVSSRRLARRELMREEAELMGHEVETLHPAEGQTYLRAVEELVASGRPYWANAGRPRWIMRLCGAHGA